MKLPRFLLPLVVLPAALDAQPAEFFLPKPGETRWENLPAEDGSVQQCLAVRTRAGLRYTIQTSRDMVTWTDDEDSTVYSLGQEIVVPIRQYTPPPPPVPGASGAGLPFIPQPRKINASLQLQRATTGGLIVSWPSLDTGGPVRVYLPQFSLPTAWDMHPWIWDTFGNYRLSLGLFRLASAPPPGEPQLLGVKDTALLAQFTESYSVINQRVVESVARARNAPPPLPSDPNSKKFTRLKVEYSVDTDGDGSPDWAEFAIAEKQMLDGAGGGAGAGGGGGSSSSGGGAGDGGASANAFGSDTNGDGIPDGEQLDFDEDGVMDAFDAAKSDRLVNWKNKPPYCYALFPLPEGREINSQYAFGPRGIPLQTCDNGNVLYGYVNQLFTEGELKNLPEPDGIRQETSIEDVQRNIKAFAMDDTGSVHGWGEGALTAKPDSYFYTLASWNPKGESPQLWREGNRHVWSLSFIEPTRIAPDMFMPTLIGGTNHERRCFANTTTVAPSTSPGASANDYTLPTDTEKMWTLTGVMDTALPPMASSPRPASWAYTVAPDGLPFGYEDDNDSIVGDHHFHTKIQRVVALPGREPVPGSPTGSASGPSQELMAIPITGPPQIRQNNQWSESPSFKETVVDISANTGFVFHKFDGKAWQNDRILKSEDVAPGVKKLEVLDAAPAGPILANFTSQSTNATPVPVLGLPICVQGYTSHPKRNVPLPLEYLGDLSLGVDNLSMLATGGNAKSSEMWIMAAQGDAFSNSVRFLSSANPLNFLKLDCESDLVTFTPDTLTSRNQIVKLNSPEGQTKDLDLKIILAGKVASRSIPVKIKSMKARTVRVAVHKVIGLDKDGNHVVPGMMPTEAELEEYLDLLYGPQVNTYFDVVFFNEGPVRFDEDGDGNLSFVEQSLATPNPKVGMNMAFQIDVWVVAGINLIVDDDQKVYGYRMGPSTSSYVIVNGDSSLYSNLGNYKEKIFLNVIAHEIGHVMTKGGHADPPEGGGAVLEGLDEYTRHRLMCSGDETDYKNPGRQLIKNEWDLIEGWLKAKIDK